MKFSSEWLPLSEQSQNQNIGLLPKVPDFITLERKELLLHFYKEPEGQYKDITKIEKLQEAQKDWNCNDDASPSPLFFYRKICGAARQCHCLSQILQRLLSADTPFGVAT
jgi:hypothetical protein